MQKVSLRGMVLCEVYDYSFERDGGVGIAGMGTTDR